MESVHQVIDGDGAGTAHKGAEGINNCIKDLPKQKKNNIVEDHRGLLEEPRVNEEAGGLQNGHARDIASSAQQGSMQKHPQGPIIRWERFLPVKTLKVLLVENDDSTRHVVGALLRNCSYEVITAANGLQAWKILVDLTNHIDLVLTEVIMPCLSGIGLLSKIMNHKSCKNIPVIMMSSNDSMGTVFKCLSKGAVDFLVKPIRKNELKNLWQHVWRRCHSSSGSGSESGIQTQKYAKSKSTDDSDNSSGGNNDDDDDDESTDLNARNGSDNGSGTQSSWTKRAVEVDSPDPLSPSDPSADPQDSTCALVIPPKPKMHCKDWLPATSNVNCQKHKEPEDDLMGKDLEIGVPRVSGEQMLTDQKNNGVTELDGLKTCEEPTTQAADLIGSMAKTIDVQQAPKETETPKGFSLISEGKGECSGGLMELPSLELSLKRLRSIGEGATGNQDKRKVLKRSELSAFTRYPTSAASNQAPTGYGGSSSPLDNSSSNNNDMGSTTKNVSVKSTQHTSAFHPVHVRASATPQVIQDKAEEATQAVASGQPREIQSQVQVQHHYHHYHHHHHHVHSTAAPQSGPSDVLAGPQEGHAANYSLNGSNSGSNGQNGSGTAANAGGTNMESANGIVDKVGTVGDNGSGSGNGSGVCHDRIAQREAALNKFRQKRKERNFGKKVRYQSRKRLAEQRPRIRGQFVRQSTNEHPIHES